MYDEPLYASLQKSCGDWSKAALDAPACRADLHKMNARLGSFDTCAFHISPPLSVVSHDLSRAVDLTPT